MRCTEADRRLPRGGSVHVPGFQYADSSILMFSRSCRNRSAEAPAELFDCRCPFAGAADPDRIEQGERLAELPVPGGCVGNHRMQRLKRYAAHLDRSGGMGLARAFSSMTVILPGRLAGMQRIDQLRLDVIGRIATTTPE